MPTETQYDRMPGRELLTNAEMAEADRSTIAAGTPSFVLMRNAARHVADAALDMLSGFGKPSGPVLVLCGPGNNGGDGFVAAQYLKDKGVNVRVSLVGATPRQSDRLGVGLSPDCLTAMNFWTGEVDRLNDVDFTAPALVIDAMLGAGLSREVDGKFAEAVKSIVSPVLSVDVPTGVNGTTGETSETVVTADRTVTFCRLKPGHVLYPARRRCGVVTCGDIGISNTTVVEIEPRAEINLPPFEGHLPWTTPTLHKFDRGHAVIVSGASGQTGAARLAARGALRIGAGLVTVASPGPAMQENAAHLTAVMLKRADEPSELSQLLSDERIKSVVIGPGAELGAHTKAIATQGLRSEAACVLDADALTSFAEEPAVLFDLIKMHRNGDATVVLTPHEGEFARLFPDLDENIEGGKIARVRAAAQRSGAVVVLKGADTVIGTSSGLTCVNVNAPPSLATAGSGDVLAGFVAGLIAQGMSPFPAACTAVWMHGEAARTFGPGLIAEDLPEQIPQVLRSSLRLG